ncbi:uncharacterized protein LY89DRAFT_665644 [Mollisia scopiformis]|uniref:Uncharacterized protein n=1 Tax=Mollisia scopiformis TaxID=149040 RepID=A0A194XLZ1_MOLSC|nr:uncharacterized protein LY89DRAFT_665644 [Mollisia scopiformis]KUJ21198.1 hypothetical protein LY89DRAFT_665644 [Mollisia scopiformis]
MDTKMPQRVFFCCHWHVSPDHLPKYTHVDCDQLESLACENMSGKGHLTDVEQPCHNCASKHPSPNPVQPSSMDESDSKSDTGPAFDTLEQDWFSSKLMSATGHVMPVITGEEIMAALAREIERHAQNRALRELQSAHEKDHKRSNKKRKANEAGLEDMHFEGSPVEDTNIPGATVVELIAKDERAVPSRFNPAHYTLEEHTKSMTELKSEFAKDKIVQEARRQELEKQTMAELELAKLEHAKLKHQQQKLLLEAARLELALSQAEVRRAKDELLRTEAAVKAESVYPGSIRREASRVGALRQRTEQEKGSTEELAAEIAKCREGGNHRKGKTADLAAKMSMLNIETQRIVDSLRTQRYYSFTVEAVDWS